MKILFVMLELSFIGLAFSLIILFRNSKVYIYRRNLVDAIFAKDDWKLRLKIYESVSYKKMVYQFWKPLNSFYNEEELLK